MFYDSELHFLQTAIKKCHVQTTTLNPQLVPEDALDMGLRKLLKINNLFDIPLIDVLGEVAPKTIYMLKDGYTCKYIYLLLPGVEDENVLVIGPYQTNNLSQQDILELGEKNGVLPSQMRDFEKYYSNLPLISDETQLIALIDTFCEFIWNGTSNYKFAEYELETNVNDVSLIINKSINDNINSEWNYKLVEARYEYENEILFAVTQGNFSKAKILADKFSKIQLDQRNSDPIRDIKNYCIIMNTLFRKAVEKGGVHPIHIDSVSSDFAKKIELRTTQDDIYTLIIDMLKTYCQLVKKHSVKNYSPTVQKIIVIIEADLTADLSLSALAKAQNINASYLSTIFKNETGKTITSYVNEKRIELAQELLKTTSLQVQTIAQYCGIFDIHYFTRLFKKITNMTPKQFREVNT